LFIGQEFYINPNKIKNKLIKFLTKEEIKTYLDYDIEALKDDFEYKKLKWPNIEYVKYKFNKNAHNHFADGGSSDDYAEEKIDVIYKIKNEIYSISLTVGYQCSVQGHCGGVEDYEIQIENFEPSTRHNKNNVYEEIMIASSVMCSSTEIAKDDIENPNGFYDKIAEYFSTKKIYLDYDIDIMKNDYRDRDLKWPNIEYIKYYYKKIAHKKFADGSKDNDCAEEKIDVIYGMNNNTYSIHLVIGYDCSIHGHSGGISDYEMKIKSFESSSPRENIYNNIIIMSNIICNKTKIAKREIGYADIFMIKLPSF
jgi:hypothetical protein